MPGFSPPPVERSLRLSRDGDEVKYHVTVLPGIFELLGPRAARVDSPFFATSGFFFFFFFFKLPVVTKWCLKSGIPEKSG